MTGEMIGDLLRPLIGKSGTIFMVVSRSGQIGFTTDHNKKLTGVEVREDGMVRLVRETGWAVIDPAESWPWSGTTTRKARPASSCERLVLNTADTRGYTC